MTFTVTASGEGTLRYQWRLNGTDIAGATAASLNLPKVQLTDAGDCTVVVTDDAGAILTVEP